MESSQMGKLSTRPYVWEYGIRETLGTHLRSVRSARYAFGSSRTSN